MTLMLGLDELTIWLGITAISLLATCEIVSPHYGRVLLAIDRRKLRTTALVVSMCFLLTIALAVYQAIAH